MEIIVACTLHNGIIGFKGKLPWNIPADLRRFKTITTECPRGMVNAVVMGRRTWESIGARCLPNRMNVIVSNTLVEESNMNGAIVCRSLDDAITRIRERVDVHKIFVIGGSQLYKDAMQSDLCKTVHVTLVHNYKGEGDAYFPIDTVLERYELELASDIHFEEDALFSFHTFVKNDA